ERGKWYKDHSYIDNISSVLNRIKFESSGPCRIGNWMSMPTKSLVIDSKLNASRRYQEHNKKNVCTVILASNRTQNTNTTGRWNPAIFDFLGPLVFEVPFHSNFAEQTKKKKKNEIKSTKEDKSMQSLTLL
ncbi:hypothetical protein VP01_2411g1, partial [Puccinia sorghi]